MKPFNPSFLTATQLSSAQICMHAFYLDIHEDRKLRRLESDGESQTRRDGMRFEEKMIQSLGNFQSVEYEKGNAVKNAEMTRRLMEEGSSWIRNAFLLRDELSGRPDLLRKVETSSSLGRFSYEPVDIKNRKYVTASDRLQLMAYAYLLSPILGRRPERGAIWLNTGEMQNVYFTDRLERHFFAVLNNMRKVRDGKLKTEPVRLTACGTCQWNDNCRDYWKREGHISLLSGIGRTLANKLISQNIRTCKDVVERDNKDLIEITDMDDKKIRDLKHAAVAQFENRIVQKRKPIFPEDKIIYYYDIETCNDSVFLHGVVRREGTQREEKYFFAETPEQEESVWHDFLKYISREDNAIIYCWTTFEYQYVASCWEKFGGDEKSYRILMRGLEDQCAFVRNHFVLPCRGYSLKEAAPVFGFKWQDETPSGLNCLSWYRQWLENNQLSVKKRIIEYNLDDVRAMEAIDLGLRAFAANPDSSQK